MFRRLLLGLLFAFLVLQCFRPAKNISAQPPGPEDFIVRHAPPPEVAQLLRVACYDCHSNNTRYPWYTNVQPVGWWLQSHVNDGKAHLNLAEFGRYTPGHRADKIDSMIDELTFRTMPLKSYTLIHRNAKLTKAESYALADWLQHLRDSMGDE